LDKGVYRFAQAGCLHRWGWVDVWVWFVRNAQNLMLNYCIIIPNEKWELRLFASKKSFLALWLI
jgi:hypothetical protein